MSLKENLQSVDGVGPSTADKLMDAIDPDDMVNAEDIEEALGYAEAGRSEYTAKLLRRALGHD